jgi:hypothetical protein
MRGCGAWAARITLVVVALLYAIAVVGALVLLT